MASRTLPAHVSTLAAELGGAAVYLAALRRFLREPLTEEQAVARIRAQRERRAESFLSVLERAVFGNPRSAYAPLLAAAGIELDDVRRLVSRHGVEGALERLYDAGVRVTIDEVRSDRVQQGEGRERPAGRATFANPLARQHYVARSGGSRSRRVRIPVDLDLLAYESGYLAIFRSAFGIESSPAAVWQPVPPGSAAIKHLLRHARLGRPLERWFSQTDPGWRGGSLRYATFTRATIAMARIHGRGYAFPRPEHTPPSEAARVARWAAGVKRRGTHAAVYTSASGAVRVCRAAEEQRLDVAGTFFRVAGEPYTRARADVVAAVGARAASSYYISDLGGLAGLPCAAPEALDDVHVPTDKLAVIQRPKAVGRSTVDLLVFTALHPLTPNVYINLEADDFGVLRERSCGCAVEQAGLGSLHVHGIRSYQKLTSDGMSFLGEDVVTLVEQVLPARVGGRATDYQLVETEEGGMPRISVVVHPAVGDVSEDEVIDAVSSFMRSRGQGLAAEMWSAGGTLRVVRREPYSTAAGKLPVVHVLDGAPP